MRKRCITKRFDLYYVEELHCPYEIHDDVLIYTTITGKRFQREMCDEISRIFNTVRPVALKDGQKRFYKLIYENELVSINRYVMGNDPFTCDPEYRYVPKTDKNGDPIKRRGQYVMIGGQIIRYRGEVPNFRNGIPVDNPTFYSREAVAYFMSHKHKCNGKMWQHIKQQINNH